MKYLLNIFAFSLLLQSCGTSNEKKQSNFSIVKSPIEIDIKGASTAFYLGDSVFFTANSNTDTIKFKTVAVYVNDSLLNRFDKFPIRAGFSTNGFRLGKQKIKISATSSSSIENKSSSITLYANHAPIDYAYTLVNSYNHDKKAYTQGLAYFNGLLYEGTGQKGLSNVRKVELESGKVIKQVNNESAIFGEGIALLDNKIYQLSWISNVGFIYDLESLQLLNKFYYTGEGWGLTTDGALLYRSDGSNKIYLHKKETFDLIDVIEVYSNNLAISNLNELEYIDGSIYANIWQEDKIAIINPKNGALEGIINLTNILPSSQRDNQTDVLNGIAYDKNQKRLFVTGKNWPKLFQIEIKESAL